MKDRLGVHIPGDLRLTFAGSWAIRSWLWQFRNLKSRLMSICRDYKEKSAWSIDFVYIGELFDMVVLHIDSNIPDVVCEQCLHRIARLRKCHCKGKGWMTALDVMLAREAGVKFRRDEP